MESVGQSKTDMVRFLRVGKMRVRISFVVLKTMRSS